MELISTFDECGYPTEETLKCVSELLPSSEIDPWEQVDYIISLWHWGDMMVKIDKEKGCFQISTGGWSGNESIIGALKHSGFWMMCWYRSECGGHYWFRIKRIRP